MEASVPSIPFNHHPNRANVKLARREWDLETRKSKEMASKEAELEAKGCVRV